MILGVGMREVMVVVFVAVLLLVVPALIAWVISRRQRLGR